MSTFLSSTALDGTSTLIRSAIERLAALPDAPVLPKSVSRKAQAAVAVMLFQAPSVARSANSIPVTSTATRQRRTTAVPAACQYLPNEDGNEFEPEMHVICTTRALHLTSHPGQGSLPGGKVDPVDRTVTDTAFRETCEEILLRPDTLRTGAVVPLCVMRPFLSKTALIVHPVVFWLPPCTAEETLSALRPSPDEVSAIWSYPLRALLRSTEPRQVRKTAPSMPVNGHNGTVPASVYVEDGEPLMELMAADKVDTHRPPQEAFRTYSEVPWFQNRPYRLHRFRSTHQLVKGLTADVLIHVAAHAYRDTPFAGPAYDVHSPSQPGWDECARYIVSRTLSGAPREKSRWGDGESGDGYGSVQRHVTHTGVDVDLEKCKGDALQARNNDLALTLREGALDWSTTAFEAKPLQTQ